VVEAFLLPCFAVPVGGEEFTSDVFRVASQVSRDLMYPRQRAGSVQDDDALGDRFSGQTDTSYLCTLARSVPRAGQQGKNRAILGMEATCGCFAKKKESTQASRTAHDTRAEGTECGSVPPSGARC